MKKRTEKTRPPEFQNIELSQLRADALVLGPEWADHHAFQTRVLLAIATALDSLAFSQREALKLRLGGPDAERMLRSARSARERKPVVL